MNNFSVKVNGREFWISRSIAVVAFVVATDENGTSWILATQRGKGTPDPEYVGKWCLPCGYLEYDETMDEAVIREVKEETGVTLNPDRLNFLNFNADPKSDKRQNVTFRYIAWVNYNEALAELTTKYSEKDEVMEVRFIPLNDIKEYSWAFNHQNLIEELVLW
jgi:ADP-ribose pyrophosphatase YjhB (NUDIX family)